MAPQRQFPEITPETAPFWDALRRHALELQHCVACGYVADHPRWVCPECLAEEFEWRAHPGTGTVQTFVWYLRPFHPTFTDVPYNVAIVDLDDGPHLISTVVGVDRERLAVGMRVQAAYEDGPERTVLVFEEEPS